MMTVQLIAGDYYVWLYYLGLILLEFLSASPTSIICWYIRVLSLMYQQIEPTCSLALYYHSK